MGYLRTASASLTMGALMMTSGTALSDPFVCDGTPYAVIGDPSVLVEIDPATLDTSVIGTVSPKIGLNGIGYNILNNYIYALVSDTRGAPGFSTRDFARIEDDGTVVNAGTLGAGFHPDFQAGTMDSSGFWYGTNNSTVFKVDLTSGTATSFTTQAVTGDVPSSLPADWAFSNSDGLLYGITSSRLYSLNPNTGVMARVATSGHAPPPKAGGAWSTSDGALYFYQNAGAGALYKVNNLDSTPVVALVGSAEPNNKFDATACAPPSITKDAFPRDLSPGDTTTYEFEIFNPLGTPLAVNFTDTIPPSITLVPGSLSPATPGGGTVTTNDGSTLAIDNITVPQSGSVSFTIDGIADAAINEHTEVPNFGVITFGSNMIRSDDPTTSKIGDDTIVIIKGDPTIGRLVWEDDNGNGIADPGEPGIPGVNVELFRLGEFGLIYSLFDTTTTNAEGRYAFSFIPPGTYRVRIDPDTGPLAGLTQTFGTIPTQATVAEDDEFNDANFGFLGGAIELVKTAEPPTVVEPGADVDFTITLTNTGLVDVDIEMIDDDQYGELQTLGCPAYTPLAPDESYSCTFTQTVSGSAGTAFTNTATATARDPDNNVLGASASAVVNILSILTVDGVVGDFVFEDRNRNGVQDRGEAPISGVTLELRDTVGTVLQTTATDGTGVYLFLAPPGDYIVAVTDTADVLAGQELTSASSQLPVTLNAGDLVQNIDFGYAFPPPPPLIQVTKSADATVISGTDMVTFAFEVMNLSLTTVDLTSLTDSVFGDLNGQGTCATGGTIAVGGTYSCQLTVELTGIAGDIHVNEVAGEAIDVNGAVTDDASDWSINFIDPVDPPVPPVPDPDAGVVPVPIGAPWWLLMAGLTVIAWRYRKRIPQA